MIRSDLAFDPLMYVVERCSIPCACELAAIYPALSSDFELAVHVHQRAGGLSWIFWHDGKPVAAMGVTEERSGDPSVWSTWMIHTDEFPLIYRDLTKFIKSALIPALQNVGAHRCHARSLATNHLAHRWFRSMGAVEESTLPAYGRCGEDFKMFRWDRRDVQ